MVSETEAAHYYHTPSSPSSKPDEDDEQQASSEVYRCLVVDSGPIIRLTGYSELWKQAKSFYTVPAVLQEIRDAKARHHLEHLPFDLVAREASAEGIQAVVNFSRQTGDYQSLSSVDLQVLGLLYDLEREGCCGDMSHVRKTPKRTVGLGKIESLVHKEESKSIEGVKVEQKDASGGPEDSDQTLQVEHFSKEKKEQTLVSNQAPVTPEKKKPSSWARIVDPLLNETMSSGPLETKEESRIADAAIHVPFGKMNLRGKNEDAGGQFSDAEDDPIQVNADNDEEEDNPDILMEKELSSDFPSLAASLTVPYEGSDGEADNGKVDATKRQEQEEARKKESLRPVSKSGKLYNSFRKYGDLMKPKPKAKKQSQESCEVSLQLPEHVPEIADTQYKNQSRIIGGTALAGQGNDVEDDGEGWITSTKDIRTMKAAGALDPVRNPNLADGKTATREPLGPPKSQRAACSTTDFAMQNVILQMNLELLSVDGVKVRKLKSWVTRCGACFKVYTNTDNAGPLGKKRLFCEHCGSDMLQRIAASVDGKSGRLRLHLSKKHKNNLRGTKFSLPKPGSGNRFQGDLLLREDQLLMGAWNQKVKMSSGGKAKSATQSIFGSDIASNVGCHRNFASSEDIHVGFGRRNPNAVKGRERRGKKKKSADKACGLRRY